MRARDVRGAVEVLFGEPVWWGSVQKCMSANVAGISPRFVRAARGRYAVSPTTTDAAATAPWRKRAYADYRATRLDLVLSANQTEV